MREVEVAVVGGGPAGLVAATTAAEAGASVLLLEAQSHLGGNLGLQDQPLQAGDSVYGGLTGLQYATRLAAAADAAGVEIVMSAPVWDLRQPLVLTYSHRDKTRSVMAKRLIVATGSSDGVTAFPGWTLPGVMLLGAIQRLVNLYGVVPGKRVLIVGGDNAGFFVARDLLAAGASVAGIVDSGEPLPATRHNVESARRAGVPLYQGHVVLRAEGQSQVEGVIIARGDDRGGVVPGTERPLDTEVVCLATHRVPQWQVAALAGCRTGYAEALGGHVPLHDADMRATNRAVFVVGDASGVENGVVSMVQGRLAGLATAADLGHPHPRAERLRREAAQTLKSARAGARGSDRKNARLKLVNAYRSLAQKGG